jgi:tRNA A37 methylthiotransferase MiaB
VLETREIFYIRCATGCVCNCTYCLIRKARAGLRSKPLDQILAEFDDGLRKSYRHFHLVGTDLGCYGFDQGSSLVELLRHIARRKEDFRLSVSHVNPRQLKDFVDDFDPATMARVARLQISPQSGSDRMLDRMKRGYTSDDFRRITSRIRSVAPRVAIESQFIVGYPDETEDDFRQTVNLLKTAAIDRPAIFPFSPEPGGERDIAGDGHRERTVVGRLRAAHRLATFRTYVYYARCLLGSRYRPWPV